jgi:hypothetical protein
MKKVNGEYVGVLSIEPLTSRLREYFGCPWLEGAYLENQGGLDTGIAYHYLERRIFNNEVITLIFTFFLLTSDNDCDSISRIRYLRIHSSPTRKYRMV